MSNKVAVLGAGSWGTALAILLAEKKYAVSLWARREELAAAIQDSGENTHYLPGVKIPAALKVDTDWQKVLYQAEMIVLAVPSNSVRQVVQEMKSFIPAKALIVNTAKGLEQNSLLRISQIMQEELSGDISRRFAVLSGPSHAEEVALGLPTAVVASAQEIKTAESVQDYFMHGSFRVYTNLDLIGVEIAGALKNIIALGTGISEGLGFGDNAKAAMITRGLAEITRLGLAMGAEEKTFAGLAGIGDLVVTCTSRHSRNRRAGMQIGQGEKLAAVLQNMGMVVEGVNTTRAAHDLRRKFQVEMPIAEETYQVLFADKPPREAVASLMTRSKTHEGEREMLNP